jgi:hypothetical protein
MTSISIRWVNASMAFAEDRPLPARVTASTENDVDAARIEGPDGDLGQFGLSGALLDADQARGAVAATAIA